jgi:hypothetical protein
MSTLILQEQQIKEDNHTLCFSLEKTKNRLQSVCDFSFEKKITSEIECIDGIELIHKYKDVDKLNKLLGHIKIGNIQGSSMFSDSLNFHEIQVELVHNTNCKRIYCFGSDVSLLMCEIQLRKRLLQSIVIPNLRELDERISKSIRKHIQHI